jgi:hypothetical protein
MRGEGDVLAAQPAPRPRSRFHRHRRRCFSTVVVMAYEVSSGRRGRPPRRLRSALLLIGGVVVVCVVGVAGLAAWNLQHVTRTAGPVRQAAEEFLGEVASGDRVGAYDRLCAETRARWSREEFVRRLAVPPTIVGYRVVDVSVATRPGEPDGTVTAELTRATGVVDRRVLAVVRDDGQWRVCGDPF